MIGFFNDKRQTKGQFVMPTVNWCFVFLFVCTIGNIYTDGVRESNINAIMQINNMAHKISSFVKGKWSLVGCFHSKEAALHSTHINCGCNQYHWQVESLAG